MLDFIYIKSYLSYLNKQLQTIMLAISYAKSIKSYKKLLYYNIFLIWKTLNKREILLNPENPGLRNLIQSIRTPSGTNNNT